jgi:hypothetical protein
MRCSNMRCLFDHLVGEHEQGRRNVETKRGGVLASKFKLYRGWNEAKMIVPWSRNSRPPSPSPQDRILEDGLRSIHREGPRRAMPH